MALHKFSPPMSGRMGILKTLASIRDSVVIEYGCMGHMMYGRMFLNKAGVSGLAKTYSTHIDEADISLGDTTRLNKAIAEIVEKDKPRVIFLLPSSVPEVIGTDLSAISKELQPQYPDIPIIPFKYGGFDIFGYRGVQEALLLLAKTLSIDIEKSSEPKFNIIGSCSDMFRFQADAEEIARVMEGVFRIKPSCIMTSHTSVDEIRHMGEASINLVVRREGIPTAEYLQNKFNTPYLIGRPYGVKGTIKWIKEIEKLLNIPINQKFIEKEKEIIRDQTIPTIPIFKHILRSHPEKGTICLGGHADVVQGILNYATEEMMLNKGPCWCDSVDMSSEDIPYFTEEEWAPIIRSHKKSLLMTSGEALEWGGGNLSLQISNPDIKWRLNPYLSPFVGFRGALNLLDLWFNAALDQEH
ncbi:nitrogenase component 1 [Clostridium sp. UBA4395]|uniref:nitrogenase component 1 n=1 Tax=Clostridium sp. UBA4395 TaxID=1946360 RepID=UPI003217C102